MQKKLIALAVAGLVSGAAFAQSNVTVYGFVDVNYLYSKNDDLKFSGMTDGGLNGSRIGFKGEEALGNGLSTIYLAEFGFTADSTRTSTAGGTFFNRQTYLGLKSNSFGTVIAGKFDGISRDLLSKGFASDVTQNYPSNVALGDQGGNGAFVVVNTGDRFDNGVKWVSPNWSGFELRAAYGFGEVVGTPANPGSTSDAAKWGIGARYSNGPIDLVAAYSKLEENSNLAAGTYGDIDGWSLGGSYDFKVAKVFASYQRENDDKALAATSTEVEKTAWTVGVRVPVGKAGTVIFEYIDAKAEASGYADLETDGWGLGYEHELSKRTKLYTAISQIDNGTGVGAAFGGSAMRAITGEKASSFMIGLRHAF